MQQAKLETHPASADNAKILPLLTFGGVLVEVMGLYFFKMGFPNQTSQSCICVQKVSTCVGKGGSF